MDEDEYVMFLVNLCAGFRGDKPVRSKRDKTVHDLRITSLTVHGFIDLCEPLGFTEEQVRLVHHDAYHRILARLNNRAKPTYANVCEAINGLGAKFQSCFAKWLPPP